MKFEIEFKAVAVFEVDAKTMDEALQKVKQPNSDPEYIDLLYPIQAYAYDGDKYKGRIDLL